jgi:hypothetical protein
MGTTIVTLGWFFILGRSIVFAMVMNAVIYERFGSISGLLLSLPVVRILPRKSAWIRKFFDVDSDGKSDKSSGTQASAASSDSTEGAK